MTVTVTLDDVRARMSPAAKKLAARRRTEVLEQFLTLRELRKAMDMTQSALAKTLKTSQDQISRLEQRHDLLLSTLRSYVEGMGGTLRLVAEFPGRKPVTIEALSELDGEHLRAPKTPAKKPAAKRARAKPARNGRNATSP